MPTHELPYIPAVVRTKTKRVCVEYYVEDPHEPDAKKRLKRKKKFFEKITLTADMTKSKRTRTVTIPDVMLPMVSEMLRRVPAGHYIYGPSGTHSLKRADSRSYGKRWSRMREGTGIPIGMQLYSLRDTGIMHMIRDGVHIHSVRQQADHTDLATTQIYMELAMGEVNRAVKEKVTPMY